MSATPRARTEGLTAVTEGDDLLVTDEETGSTVRLRPVTAAVWRHANGSATVADLSWLVHAELGIEISESMLWSSLDLLADYGLLAERAAPPAGDVGTFDGTPQHSVVDPPAQVGRRSLLAKLGVVGAATAAGIAIVPDTAAARSSHGSGDQPGRGRGDNRGGGLPACRAEEEASKEETEKLQVSYDQLAAQEQGDKEALATAQSEEQAAKSGESDCKSDVNSEQTSKEQTAKGSQEEQQKEQSAKQDQEQAAKQSAEEQAKEQSAKGSQEEQQKEQSAKQDQEQTAKQSAEKQSKEQTAKSSEEQSKEQTAKGSQEEQQKEQSAKQAQEQVAKSAEEQAKQQTAAAG